MTIERKKMDNAERFIELIQEGKIKKDILPNTAPDYTKSQEQKDLKEYCLFLNSFAFDELFKGEVKNYIGDEQI